MRRRVRIVHLVSALNVGGLEKVVLDLVRFTDRTKFSLHILCLHEKGTLAPLFKDCAVPVESLDCADCGKCRTLYRLVNRLRQLRPDVLHTHNPTPHLFGALASQLLGIPTLIHTKHGRNYPDRFRPVLVNRLASSLSQRIVAVSSDAARVAREIERVPRQKVIVIRNGIDLTAFPPVLKRQGYAGKRAIHVARLNPVKDQKTLLHAARLVSNEEPGFRMDIVGDGPARTELQTLARELDLERYVTFQGHREDIRDLMIGADLFVLSSLKEGISLTLLEAMACSLPVVSTDVGGNPEVVIHGQTGLLVPKRSPELLATAMLAPLRNPILAASFGASGRRRVEDEFSLKRVVQQYEELYLDTI